MKILDLLKPESVKIGGAPKNKADTIDQMIALMEKQGNVDDIATYKKAVLAREAEMSTGVENGLAIPHGKSPAVNKPGLAAMTIPSGVDYESLDGEPTTLVFLIAAPDTEDNVHLQVLASLSQLLVDTNLCDRLRAAKTTQEFLNILSAAEEAQYAAEEEKKIETAKKEGQFDIVAITACPTGIAHTYMAAESLEKAAKARGISIKVETQGSGGAKNVLSAADVAGAKGVIIAADKKIELDRFGGKHVLQTGVTKGIQEPDELIDKILKGEAPVLEGGAAAVASDEGDDTIIHQIYKHLMNGISHMLPFVIGGGILTAISFLLDGADAGTSIFGMGNTQAALFKTIGSTAFGFMLSVLAGFVAMSIADRPGLAVGFTGGALANTGYTFGYLANYAAISDGFMDDPCVSGGFIGALIAGFLGGYIVLWLEKVCDKLPATLEGIKPMLIYPVGGILITGVVVIIINPVMGAINTGISNFLNGLGNAGALLGAVLGGMMSVDFGGPINKAAYAFGTAALADGTVAGEMVMASVMAGGMVPPLVIALSTTFFKNRWSKTDRDAGLVNYIMGLSFISEGAIPYAAADPLHVIPSCIVGSAIAGALSWIWGCACPAPHGGAWVVAVVTNWPLYLLAILIGSVVGALIISVWKKPLPPEKSGLTA